MSLFVYPCYVMHQVCKIDEQKGLQIAAPFCTQVVSGEQFSQVMLEIIATAQRLK